VAVHVIVVLPSGKTEPEALLQFTVGFGSTLSVAETLYDTAAPEALVASTVMLPGMFSVGAVESDTVIVKVAVA
jgi:hypothetical protein